MAAGAGPNRPESQDGRAPFRGLVRPPKAPPAARGRVNGQSERSGTGRMSDFVPGVRSDGAAPAELGGWDAVTSGSSNYPANVLLYTVTYLSSTSGSVVDSCVLLFLRSLLPCFLIFPVRGPSKGLVVGRGGRYSPKGLGWALWYSMVLYGTLWYSMVLCGTLWYSMVLYGTLWYSVVLCPWRARRRARI